MRVSILIIFLISLSINAQEVVAHRGIAHMVPENSIPAFQNAWKQGADFIEADFHLTSDNQVVCFHDSDTKSINGVKLRVENCSWPQLKQLDIGINKTTRGKGFRMPLLHEVLETVPPEKGIFIEIKSDRDISSRLKQSIEQSNVDYSQIHIISFNPEVLAKCKKVMPRAKFQWLVKIRTSWKTGVTSPNIQQIITTLQRIKVDGVGTNFHSSVLTATNVTKLQKAGFYWNVWTINKVKRAQLLQRYGVDYITTDKPSLFKSRPAQ